MSQKLAKQDEQKEVGEIKLGDDNRLVASIVASEKLDLRIWIQTDRYSGPTKRGVRFYLFDGIWEEFKKLLEKVDKEYQKLA